MSTIVRPFIYQLRDGSQSDPFIDITESVTPMNGRAVLQEIPDRQFGVLIDGYVEKRSNTKKDGEFYVDYSNGVIYLPSAINSEVSVRYRGRGVVKVPAERIFFVSGLNHISMDVTLREMYELITNSNSATEELKIALDAVILATSNANSSALEAQNMATLAEEKAGLADLATQSANAAASNANIEASNLAQMKSDVVTATSNANIAASNADSKAALADQKATLANDASVKADLAATNAQSKAVLAEEKALMAETEGNIARSRGEYADAMGLEASTQAAYAKTQGDFALLEATNLQLLKDGVSNATISANTAASEANIAAQKADSSALNADTKAGAAQIKINEMTTLASDVGVLKGTLETKISEANTATSESVLATGNANTAASFANEKGLLAQTEASNLNQLKTSVTEATLLANGSASNAQIKANLAEEKANFAQQQGDYAKAQGDVIQGILDNGTVSSVNGKTGAVVISASDVGTLSTAEIGTKIKAEIDDLVGAAPDALNTLNELSQALGNDPNFATTITNDIATKATKSDLTSHSSNTSVHLQTGERESWNAKLDASKVGAVGGVASLGLDGKVVPEQLPQIASSWNDLKDKPTEFNPSSHTHNVSDVTGLQEALDSAVKMEKYETVITAIQGQAVVQIPWVTFDSVNDYLSVNINRTVLTPDDYVLTGRNMTLNETLNVGDSVHITVLKAVVRGVDEPISAANIADGSITNEKLGSAIKIGDVSSLNTFEKSDVVSAVNEVFDSVNTIESENKKSLSEYQKKKAIDDVLIYYGYPIGFNGMYSRERVSDAFAKYEVVVLGDTYQNPAQEVYADTVAIVELTKQKNPSVKIFGYVPIGAIEGVADSNLSMAEIKNRIDQWSVVGASGVFLDEYGFDYFVTRERQNEIVSYAHSKNMNVIANSWSVDYVFNDQPMYLDWISFQGNPNSLAPVLNEDDYILFENAWYYDMEGVQAVSHKTQWNSETRMYEAYYYKHNPQADGKSYYQKYKTKSIALDMIKSSVADDQAEVMAQTGKLASVVMGLDGYSAGYDSWSSSGTHREYNLPNFSELHENVKTAVSISKKGTAYYNVFSRSINGVNMSIEWTQDDTTPGDPNKGVHSVFVGKNLMPVVSKVESGIESAANQKNTANQIGILLDKVDDLKTVKSSKDANGIFTTLTYRRKSDDSLFATSVLSGGTSPNYTTRTVTYYETNGTTVRETITYTLTYDTDGALVSEV